MRIDRNLAERVARFAALLGPRYSANALAEQCITAFLEMAEAGPEARTVPRFILLLDAARMANEPAPSLPARCETVQNSGPVKADTKRKKA